MPHAAAWRVERATAGAAIHAHVVKVFVGQFVEIGLLRPHWSPIVMLTNEQRYHASVSRITAFRSTPSPGVLFFYPKSGRVKHFGPPQTPHRQEASLPTHVYQPTRNPPSWMDRILVHPMDSTVAVLSLLYGLLAIGSLLIPNFTPSNSIDLLPTLVTGAVSAFWTVGGTLAIVGIFWFGDNVSTGWGLERLGWILSAGGLLVYGVSTLWHYPESIYSWMTPTLLGLGGLLRFLSVYLIERHTRRVIAEVKGHPLVS